MFNFNCGRHRDPHRLLHFILPTMLVCYEYGSEPNYRALHLTILNYCNPCRFIFDGDEPLLKYKSKITITSAIILRIFLFFGAFFFTVDGQLPNYSLTGQCGFPGSPFDGSVAPLKSVYDTRDTVTFSCLTGYILVGPRQVTCHKDSTWSSETPHCLKEAADIERSAISDDNVNTCVDVTNNKALKLRTTPFSQHSIKSIVISFSKVTGSPNVEVTISNDGTKPQKCVTVPNVLLQDSNLYHNFDCASIVTGNTVQISIQSMRAFSPVASVTVCEVGIAAAYAMKRKCGSPQIPANGSIKNKTDDRVTYNCVRGFYIESGATSHCEDGVWKNLVHCKNLPLNCGFPGSPQNGFHEYADAITGTIRYACLPGYILEGPSIRSCLPNGTWSPQSIPKCLTNVAYGKYVSHSDMSSGANKPSVDENPETCDVIGFHRLDRDQQRWWKLDFGSIKSISNVRIIQPRGQQKRLKVASFYNDAAPRINVPCIANRDKGLLCELRPPSNVQGIYILPDDKQDNFTLCEVQITNQMEQVACGTIDEQLHGKVAYRPNEAMFSCDVGYTLHGTKFVSCENGLWKSPYPTCTTPAGAITTRTARPILTPTIPSRYTTDPSRSNTHIADNHEAEKGSFMVGILGIAIGVTAASVSIIIAVIVIVCVMKRKKHACNHNCSPGCSQQNTNSTTYNTSRSGGGIGGGNQRDWDECSIHLYETVKPEYDTLDPCDQSLVVNESYILNSPKNSLNRNPVVVQRPRLAPPRSNHIYDSVAIEESLLDRDGRPRDLFNGDLTNGNGSVCRRFDPGDTYPPNIPLTDL